MSKVKTLNWFQACNRFKISGINREVVKMKYFKEEFTISSWKSKLIADKLMKIGKK